MSFRLEADSNARELAKQFGELAHKQIPFATAVALTRTAQDARNHLRDTLDRHFTIRARRRMERGISIKRAEKRDWPKPSAQVGTRDEFMVPHVTGGTKRAKRGAKHVAIPAKWIKRTATGRIPKSMKPRRVREKPSTFVTSKQIKRRQASSRSRSRTRGLQTLYLLRDRVKIDRRWPFEDLAREASKKNYADHFQRELGAAIRSARVRSGSFTSEQGRVRYWTRRKSTGGAR